MDEKQRELLLSRWHRAREEGTAVSIEELCADCPEQVEELKRPSMPWSSFSSKRSIRLSIHPIQP